LGKNHAMSLPILYSFRRCPYAIRARLALCRAGIELEVREVALRDKPAALREISPKATVPVLVLPSGEVLEQSLDIMRWALRQNDPQGWLNEGQAGPEQAALIALNDGEFKALLDRYKYPQRHPEACAESYRDAAVALALAPLEQRLGASNFLMGEQPRLADIALLPFVRQFAAVDAGWFEASPLPALNGWLQRLTATPLFEAVLQQKLAPWRAGAAPTLLVKV
jgi:glutathione S-transferase